jgi:excisionase family DNA binding protein
VIPALDLAAQLRALADQVEHLDPAQVLGELEALRFTVWASALAPAAATPAPVAPRYVTQAEAAVLFNIPLSTVRYLTRRGRVPALGQGKNRRLLPADLARYLEECTRTGRALRPSGRSTKRPLRAAVPLE